MGEPSQGVGGDLRPQVYRDERPAEAMDRVHEYARTHEPGWTYPAVRVVMGPPARLLYRLRASGLENVPAEGPMILAPNHFSNFDHFFVGVRLRREIRFMAKSQFFGPGKNRALDYLFRNAGHFPVRRGYDDQEAFITAASILEDSPVQLDTASGLYVPRNYDNAFMGPVSVRRALANSLNVPAVRALLLDGVQDFRDRLADLGYDGLEADGSYYGFSLALGSAEVTLLEQANAYRTLANLGRWSPLRIKADDPAGEARQVLDPGAAWIVGDMLSDPSARASTFGVDSALRLPFWAAAKTGTSKAMRDNWCIGYSDRFTVAVWVGNLEGDPMRAVSGTSGAAPVWRDVMIALHQGRRGQQPPRPEGVSASPVSFATGREPPRSEWFLAGTAQGVMAQAPEFARRPHIANPVSGAVYARDPDIPGDRQSIGVSISGDAGDLSLTLDGRPLPKAATGYQIPLLPGSHLLALSDASGRKLDQVRFTVR